jgi:Flp pilus assembly protein protease CpaA
VEYPADSLEWIALAVAAGFAIIAAVIDFRQFRIPNALTLPLCLAGWLFHAAAGGLAGLQYSVGGTLTGFFVLVLFHSMGAMGAGDVKLLAACGAWIGATNTAYVFLAAALLAGLYSLAVLAWQQRLADTPMLVQAAVIRTATWGRNPAGSGMLGEHLQRPDRRRHVLPFGLMIALGLFVVGFFR